MPKLRTILDYEMPDTSQSYQRLRVEDEFDLMNTEVLGTDKLVHVENMDEMVEN